MNLHPDADTLLLYDFLDAKGGAERVLHVLQRHLDAPVCVGYVKQPLFAGTFDPASVIDLDTYHAYPPLKIAHLLHAFSSRGARCAARYPTRIYSGSYAVLAHRREHTGRAIYYCHTPPRFLYDLRERYASTLPVGLRPPLAVLRRWLQPRYEDAVRRMDVVLANSENVRRRLERFLGVRAQVVYPPVDVDAFRWIEEGDYFLSTARLEPLKRIDLLIRAFREMPDQRLVIGSGGSQANHLRRLAEGADNIHFTGWLDDDALANWIGRARATLYVPVDEDFGMSPVESMAAGKPVIGVAEGGLLETVVPGRTGELLPPDFDAEQLRAAVSAMTRGRAASMREACEAQARRFSRERFLRAIDEVLCGRDPRDPPA